MSISVHTAAWGNYWEIYGQQWTKHIKSLDPQPDRVLIISDKMIESEFDVIVTNVPDRAILSHFRNIAIKNIDTIWSVPIDLDDTPYEYILYGLKDEYDIHAFAYTAFNDQQTFFPDEDIWINMFSNINYKHSIAGVSAIKTEVIKECGGYPDIELEDAGLWCIARKKNKTVFFDKKIRFSYRYNTRSLSNFNISTKAKELNDFFTKIKNTDAEN